MFHQRNLYNQECDLSSLFLKAKTIIRSQNKAVFYIGGAIVVAGVCFVVFKSSKKKETPLTDTKEDIKTTAS